ncbi:MAG: hypothetical protein JWO05_3149 [Gemmatimonadetes bacterium]|nr:hypothetical protein [Gemmatimonadota bacterium]
MKSLFLAVLMSAIAVAPIEAQAKPSAPVTLIASLYAAFACEAVVDAPGCDSTHELMDQPKPVLARYFDAQMVRLWLADRKCAAQSREICSLDFAPMWSSQDPIGTTVRILPTNDPRLVDVELLSPQGKTRQLLRYTLVKTPQGWRIHDISLGKEWSLLALLSRKP